jgi:serine/threonine-protein kinase HipA
MNRKALVRLDGQEVGVIVEYENGFGFQYLESWLQSTAPMAVSLTLPLRPEPYLTRYLHPFFQNLLPEGWLLELATNKLKISKDDPFGLLMATCADCVGAAEVVPWPEEPD